MRSYPTGEIRSYDLTFSRKIIKYMLSKSYLGYYCTEISADYLLKVSLNCWKFGL